MFTPSGFCIRRGRGDLWLVASVLNTSKTLCVVGRARHNLPLLLVLVAGDPGSNEDVCVCIHGEGAQVCAVSCAARSGQGVLFLLFSG